MAPVHRHEILTFSQVNFQLKQRLGILLRKVEFFSAIINSINYLSDKQALGVITSTVLDYV